MRSPLMPAFFLVLGAFGSLGAAELPKQIIKAAANPDVRTDAAQEYTIKGLILAKANQNPDTLPQKPGIQFFLDKGNYKDLILRLEPFLNTRLSTEAIHQIKTTISSYFLQEKKQYVAVLVPVQDVTDGVVVFQVLPGKVGEIRYVGQRWVSRETLEKSSHLRPGDVIIEDEMMDYMSWINKNPFRRTQVILSPGAKTGTSDVEFFTQERFPIRFYAGSDNTGFKPTSQTRLFGGMNWGNALKVGDLLSYQYTASPDFHQFQSHVLSYTSYLPWKNILTVFGCYGIVFPDIPDFETDGLNIQTSARYSIPFKHFFGDFTHNLDFGFDWKYITSNLFFAGDAEQGLASSTTNNTINVTQFLTSYSFKLNWPSNVLQMTTNITFSPWKNLLPFQSTTAYNQLRNGSHVRYGYLRLSASHRYQLPSKCVLVGLLRGQGATGALPTSEQFGLGGADTVRGYYEQQFVADNAVLLNLEFYSPPLSLFKGKKNELTFLAFFDYGWGYNYEFSAPEFETQSLYGIGPGLRYDILPNFSLRLDYGFQLRGVPGDHRIGRLNFSINVSN